MDRESSLNTLADVLEQVLVEPGENAMSIIQSLPSDLHADALDVLANVMHFTADADIRRDDVQYRSMQETQMRQLIGALRHGASRSELLQYSFLSW